MKAATHAEPKPQPFVQSEEVVEAAVNSRQRSRRITKLRTLRTFLRRGACSTTLMTVLDRAHGQPMDLEERAAVPLGGGLMLGYQCGMIWGSTLAAGAKAHALHGAGPRAEVAALHAADKVVGSFRAIHNHVDCLDITDTDPQNTWQTVKYFLLKGGSITCARRMARYAPEAHREINDALTAEGPRPGCDPANCAAELARTMGAAGRHVTMAAGLAGGIGLSGGACGALGAAIWITAMQGRTAGDSNKIIDARIEALKERFQEAADYQYECSQIVGRRFESIDDHSDHVRRGGCAAIIGGCSK